MSEHLSVLNNIETCGKLVLFTLIGKCISVSAVVGVDSLLHLNCTSEYWPEKQQRLGFGFGGLVLFCFSFFFFPQSNCVGLVSSLKFCSLKKIQKSTLV